MLKQADFAILPATHLPPGWGQLPPPPPDGPEARQRQACVGQGVVSGLGAGTAACAVVLVAAQLLFPAMVVMWIFAALIFLPAAGALGGLLVGEPRLSWVVGPITGFLAVWGYFVATGPAADAVAGSPLGIPLGLVFAAIYVPLLKKACDGDRSA